MYCPKCGADVGDGASFCHSCGSVIYEERNDTHQTTKNIGVTFLFVSIIVQIVSFSLILNVTGVLSTLFSCVFILSSCSSFISSIVCIVKSKNAVGRKGRTIGIIFVILSILVAVLLVPPIIMLLNDNSTQNKIDERVQIAAEKSVGMLYSNLKNPSSMQINIIKADARRSNTHGTNDGSDESYSIDIYIDYSAMNGFGGMNRECYYFKYDEYFLLEKCEKIDNVPSWAKYTLDAQYYNSLDYSSYLK